MAAIWWGKALDNAGAQLRAQAARAVLAVQEGRSLDVALAQAQAKTEHVGDRALIAAISFGVTREWRLLDTLASQMWKKTPPPIAQALILVGLYQLRSLRVPPHAAVHATVAATNALRIPKMRGMVNALLRRYQRDEDKLIKGLRNTPGITHSHPDWLVDALKKDWPDNANTLNWQNILLQNNTPAPMVLRVNKRHNSREDYRAKLAEAGIAANAHELAPQALVLAEPVAVDQLPGFDQGWVSVQDAAAQLAAPLLDIQPGMRVLDACAAPGGKTGHCLELADCDMVALDSDDRRLELVEQTCERLGLAATTRCTDASETAAWWDGKAFDRILIDAPCTGTGVIRRHPDIKWLRRQRDVAALAARQRALLDALWPLLASGGVLVYATCSSLRAEGTTQIKGFLNDTPSAQAWPAASDWGNEEAAGRRIAPGQDGMDGFYYARLRKA